MSIELATISAAEHKQAILERIQARKATAADFIAYNLLRGKPASQGFTPNTAERRFRCGRSPFAGFEQACRRGYWPSVELNPALEAVLDDSQRAALRAERIRLLALAFERGVEAGLPKEDLRGLLTRAMLATPQGKGSVMSHCQQTVKAAVGFLVAMGLANPADRSRYAPAWTPAWLFETAALNLSQPERQLLQRYLAVHDCGKPFVFRQDQSGKIHFPEHAAKSAEVWRQAGGAQEEAWLIEHDMDLHTMSASELEELAKHPLAKVLLVAALASLSANARDFGGEESTSFKMKLKHLDRRGRALCKLLTESSARVDWP